MSDVDKLAAAYEKALQAHWDDPTDERKHQASVAAAERLATARTAQRQKDIEAGTRSPGIGVVVESEGE
jgi:hypothetical protein